MIGTIIAIVIMYLALKWHSKTMNANTFDCYEKMKEAWASGHKMKAVGLALLVFWVTLGCLVIDNDRH